MAKALLQFSKGVLVFIDDKLSIYYLKIYGANCFGLNKLSFNDRLKWVDENINKILNFENGELISNAENKLLFIAFCFEFKKYYKSLKNQYPYFTTNLPLQLDATCNGFQHLSLMLMDATLAYEVNLGKSTWSDKPQDFYTFLALKIKDYWLGELTKDLDDETKDSYTRLCNIDFKLYRSLLKRTIMTIPYNATVFTNISEMKAEFDQVKT